MILVASCQELNVDLLGKNAFNSPTCKTIESDLKHSKPKSSQAKNKNKIEKKNKNNIKIVFAVRKQKKAQWIGLSSQFVSRQITTAVNKHSQQHVLCNCPEFKAWILNQNMCAKRQSLLYARNSNCKRNDEQNTPFEHLD